jgi:hypothetical protein
MKEYLESGNAGVIAENTIKKAFPELKESEDERIRKAMINGFNKLDKSAVWYNGITNGQILAWLEKQEQKPTNTDNKFIRMRETKPKDISEFLDRLTTVEQEFLWEHIAKIRELDKQEQKDILEDAILDSNEDGLIAETIRYKNEQKLVDKVEPKFHKGEWIVFNGLTLCVKEVVKGFYITTSIDGITNGYDWDIDNAARLWTIRDAKDGDVLYMDNGLSTCTFIYKSINNVIIQKYASYNKFGFEGTTYLVLNDGYVCPATKEQRDTLLKAMADARYTFDFDKKELKNIEQKSAEWHREDEQNLNACLGFIRDEFLRKWLIDIIHSKYDKPSWSEEDKKMITKICQDLYDYPRIKETKGRIDMKANEAPNSVEITSIKR